MHVAFSRADMISCLDAYQSSILLVRDSDDLN